MPRSFTEQEKEKIREKLIKTGTEQFGRYGLRRTTVEDIVREAGIAKGSFYLFFPSKEDLMYACIGKLETEIRENDIYPLLARSESAVSSLEKLFDIEFALSEKYPLLSILDNPQEFEMLFRAVQESRLKEHLDSDYDLGEVMMKGLYPEQKWDPKDIKIITGLIRGILMLRVHKEIIGEDIYPDVKKLLCRALAFGLDEIILKGEKTYD